MTIAQQLGIKDFPFEIRNKQSKLIYHESSNGYWTKYEYDSNGNLIYYKNSGGYWTKREYDANNNDIYFESSSGLIVDNRPKPVEIELNINDIFTKSFIDNYITNIKK